MPHVLRENYLMIPGNSSIADILSMAEADEAIWVVETSRGYTCFSKKDLLALAAKLKLNGINLNQSILQNLAERYAVPPVRSNLKKERYEKFIHNYRPLYDLVVVNNQQTGRPARLLISTEGLAKISHLNQDIVVALSLGEMPKPFGWAMAKPPGDIRDRMDGAENGTTSGKPSLTGELPGDNMEVCMELSEESVLEMPYEEPVAPSVPSENLVVGPVEESHTIEPLAVEPAKLEQRYVNGHLYRVDGADRQQLTQAFIGGKPHSLELWIGKHVEDAIHGGPSTIDSSLPQGFDQYEIKVLFTEPNHLSKPITGKIMLPAHKGESSHCWLNFNVAAEHHTFCGRLAFYYGNRILETWLLEGRVLAEGQQPAVDEFLAFSCESSLSSNLGKPNEEHALDACVLQEKDQLTFLSGDALEQMDLEGIEEYSLQIEDILGDVTGNPNNYQSLEDINSLNVLRNLARQGYMLYRYLSSGTTGIGINHPLFSPTTIRVQLLSVNRSILPLEFTYVANHSPLPNSQFCPQGKEALLNSSCECIQSEAIENGTLICPLRFWGLNRVIERRMINVSTVRAIQSTGVFNPSPSSECLTPFKSVNYCYSHKVKATDSAPLEKYLGDQFQIFDIASNWDDWLKNIKENNPHLLLILSHTFEAGGAITIEIGTKSDLSVIDIDTEYIHDQPETKPIAMLLGCSTATPHIPFEGLAPRFYENGAALTVTTLIPVLGRHVTQIAIKLIEEFKRAAEQQESFGICLLRARQKALAAGYLTAMALVADGHIDWKISQ
jgi:hypothetical protein